MSRKALAVAALGTFAIATLTPVADAVTRRTTTTKKPAPVTTAAPTTAAPTTAPATTAAPAGKKGGNLIDVRNFSNGDPQDLDPGISGSVNASQVILLLWDGLMELDYETNEIKPNVAESVSTNAAGDVVTFKLRKGVKFSNGEDVLPSNFKCAWERVANPALASTVSYHLDTIKGKKLVDEGKSKTISGLIADDANLTLRVELTTPYADFIAETTHTLFSPLTKEACNAGRNYGDGLMIGNGPFKLAEPWRRGQFIKLVRNDSYFGGYKGRQALLDSLEFRIVRDELAALNVFESGGADIAGIPGGKFNELTKKYGSKFSEKAQLVIQYIGFNWDDPQWGGFSNAKLRQAASVAINRKQINDAIFDGSRKEATGFTPPGIPGVRPTTFGVKETADVETARKLLAEYGKPAPKLTLKFANSPTNTQISSIIRNNLQAVGIEVEFDAMLPTTYFNEIGRNPGQAFRAGWAADFLGYDNFINPLWSTAATSPDGNNRSRFSNAEVDRLIARARATSDEKRRGELYYQAEKIIMDQAVVIPLYWNKWANITSPKVARLPQGPTAFIDYAEVSLN